MFVSVISNNTTFGNMFDSLRSYTLRLTMNLFLLSDLYQLLDGSASLFERISALFIEYATTK